MISCKTTAELEAVSLGLITTVFPPAIAPINGPSVSWKGKLNALRKSKSLAQQELLEGKEVNCTHPITKTQPNGSFRIFGFTKEFVKSISGAFSSFTHFSEFFVTKTISFSTQPMSAR